MRITLVEPRAPGLHIWTRFRLPRLGPLTLGTILARAGHDVRVLFEEAHGLDWKRLNSSELVGISTVTSTAPRAYAIAYRLRAAGVPVVLGGVHPTMLPDEALDRAEWVLRGEAEETILPFVRAVERATGFDEVPGLSWWRGGERVHNPAPPPLVDLDRLPFPDLSLLARPLHPPLGQHAIVPILTSRGCPHDCSFCCVTAMFGRRYRYRSAASVLAELRSHDLSGKRVFFYDDNFTASHRRTAELLGAMIAAGVTPPWSAQVAIDCAFDPELLNLMRRAGGDTLFIGLESTNPATLRAFHKPQTVGGMERGIEALNRHGFHVHGMFVFGSDEDTPETIRATARWARAQGLYSVQFLILTPLPGTRVFRELDGQGRLLARDWSLYDSHHVLYRPARMRADELLAATFVAQGRFYSPWQTFRRLARGDLGNVLVRLYAHKLNRRWVRRNRHLMEPATSVGTPHKS